MIYYSEICKLPAMQHLGSNRSRTAVLHQLPDRALGASAASVEILAESPGQGDHRSERPWLHKCHILSDPIQLSSRSHKLITRTML